MAILAFPGVQLLDVAGPAEVFTTANAYGARYDVRIVSAAPGPVPTSAPSGWTPAPAGTTCRTGWAPCWCRDAGSGAKPSPTRPWWT
ncbi:hypothetical protein ACFQ3Z_42645 [Streptomyces nogalater]